MKQYWITTAVLVTAVAALGGWGTHSFRSERNDVQQTLASTQEAKSLLEKEKEAGLKSIAALETELASRKEQIAALETDNACMQDQIGWLYAERSRITGELEIAQAKVTKLTSDIASLEVERNDYRTKLAALEKAKEATDAELADLRTKHDELDKKHGKFLKDVELETERILAANTKIKEEMLQVRLKLAEIDKEIKADKILFTELKTLCETHGTTIAKIEKWVTERNAADIQQNEYVRKLERQVQQQDDFQAQIAGHMKIKLPTKVAPRTEQRAVAQQ